jgi:hypothetical protein
MLADCTTKTPVKAAKKEVARSAKKKGLMQAARKENVIPVTPCPRSEAAVAATPDQGEGGADGEACEKVVDTGEEIAAMKGQ